MDAWCLGESRGKTNGQWILQSADTQMEDDREKGDMNIYERWVTARGEGTALHRSVRQTDAKPIRNRVGIKLWNSDYNWKLEVKLIPWWCKHNFLWQRVEAIEEQILTLLDGAGEIKASVFVPKNKLEVK